MGMGHWWNDTDRGRPKYITAFSDCLIVLLKKWA
jgi:hypothetical protein